MKDLLDTMLVFGGVALAAIAICEIIRAIQALRIRMNHSRITELEVRNAKLMTENAGLHSAISCAAAREFVHNETITRLEKENEALEAENRMLMEGTPVVKAIRVKRVAH